MSIKALIWGITGQDGSYLAEYLLNQGNIVIGVTRRSSVDNLARLSGCVAHKQFILEQGDVTDPLSVYRLIDMYKPHHVYNLAAQSNVGVSFKEPLHTFDVTAKGTLNILESILRIDKWRIKYYQAGSSEMFGNSVNDNGFQDEKTLLAPRSPYAVAKVAAHNLTKMYREAYGIFACNGILFNHESPRRGEAFVTRKITLWMAKVISKWQNVSPEGTLYDFIKDNPHLKIKLGNLDSRRDWGHAKDYVRAMYGIMNYQAADDFVVATGSNYSIRDFLNLVFDYVTDYSSKRLDIESCVEIDHTLFRPADVVYLKGDATKARRELGWVPEYDFKKLVEEMVYSDICLTNSK